MYKANKARNAFIAVLLTVVIAFFSFSCHAAISQQSLTPTDALNYMKKTPNLYILDVSPQKTYKTANFVGSHNIPSDELLARINEIPKNRPVIVSCRLGRTSVKSFQLIRKLRPDISELYHIDGVPLFDEYNAWAKKKP